PPTSALRPGAPATATVARTSISLMPSASRSLPTPSPYATRRRRGTGKIWRRAAGLPAGRPELVVAFDELDRRIVAALVDDGRATYAEGGARGGLSAPAGKRRGDRLVA